MTPFHRDTSKDTQPCDLTMSWVGTSSTASGTASALACQWASFRRYIALANALSLHDHVHSLFVDRTNHPDTR